MLLVLKELKAAEELSKNPNANGSTAKISPPAASDSDSDGEEFNSYINTIKQNNSDDFGYNYVQNITGFSILGVVTEDNIPNYGVMKETEFIADKSCIVCPEEDMDLEALSEHYCYEHTITFTETYEDDLETFQRMAIKYPGESISWKLYSNQNSNQSSGEEQEISDFESLFDLPPLNKSGSNTDDSSSEKHSKSQGNKSGSSSDSSSSTKSSRSRGNKKSKSRGSRDIESLRTQVTSQKNFFEKELSSSLKQMEEKMSENQTKKEKDDEKIASGIEKISTSLVTIADNQSALIKQNKHFENVLASNAASIKEKDEENEKKELRTLEYLETVEGRLLKMENALHAFQEGQKPIENCITPKQTEPEVTEDSITVQKSQINIMDSLDKSQLEKVPEPSTNESVVSMDTVEIPKVSGKRSIKISKLKKKKNKLRMIKLKKENRKIPEEKKEQAPQNFMSLLFNFLINFTNGMFTLLNNIISSPTGIIWGIMFLLALFAIKIQAEDTNESSIIHQSPNDLFLSNSNSNITQLKLSLIHI